MSQLYLKTATEKKKNTEKFRENTEQGHTFSKIVGTISTRLDEAKRAVDLPLVSGQANHTTQSLSCTLRGTSYPCSYLTFDSYGLNPSSSFSETIADSRLKQQSM